MCFHSKHGWLEFLGWVDRGVFLLKFDIFRSEKEVRDPVSLLISMVLMKDPESSCG